MKNTLKRILCALLVAAMAAAGASCSDKTPDNPDAPADNSVTVSDETEEPAETRIPDSIPDSMNLDDTTFRIYLGDYTTEDFDYEEEKAGDLMNDAVYTRNLAVEERLHVRFETTYNGDYEGYVGQVRNIITSGDSGIDFVCGGQVRLTPLTYESVLIDWNTLEYADLEKPWWDKGILEQLNFADKVFMATGDIVVSNISQTSILLFNKQMMTDNNLEYPYDAVIDGKWTHDEFSKYLKVVLNDLNGDGKFTADDDVFGLTGWCCEIGPNFVASYGINFLDKDENALPVPAIYSETNNDKMQKICDMFAEGSGAYDNTTGWGVDITMFKENRALFEDSRFVSLPTFRDMKNDFGIIPHPKYDEAQTSYRQRVSNVGSVVVVPISNNRVEETSAVLEALAKESYYSLTPTYFDVTLTIKATRDEDSANMLTLIRDSKVYNAEIKSWGQSQIMNLTATAKNTFASSYASAEKALYRELDKMIEAYTAGK